MTVGLGAIAQESEQITPAVPAQTTIVHGFVRNGISGSPVPRVLVRINGDAATGVMTDGDGHFEIQNVPVGPQEFTVLKPGYLDSLEARAENGASNARGYGHNVIVAPEMGDVVFNMQPMNSITGQIQLSTGDVADGIQVMLLKRIVQDGRAAWQVASTSKTNSEGMYRFGELTDGLYAVFTQPVMDDTSPDLVEPDSATNSPRQGFASVFYPEARNLTDASKIRLEGGDQAQANMTLTPESFQPVTASVTLPGRRYSEDISVQVLDGLGQPLPYSAQYDSSTHTARAVLPDGAYSFVAMLMLTRPMQVNTSEGEQVRFSVKSPAPISGQVSFAVTGHAVTNLRLPMSSVAATHIQVNVAHGSDSPTQNTEPEVFVTLTDAGAGTPGGVTSAFAEGKISSLVQTAHPLPGPYWVHTSIANNTLCESSFLAGAVSLAHEPLQINDARSTGAPLVLALRDDCAKLTLTLPGSVAMTSGIERFFSVYVVPDFDSTADVVPQTLRLSTGGRVTITGLTPGSYHVYTFDQPVALEYRNPAVLREFPSQAITLAPNAEAQLIVEVGQP